MSVEELTEPFAVGTVVIGTYDLVDAGVKRNTAQKITKRQERKHFCAGKIRWFYELDNSGKVFALSDYFKLANGTCQPTK